MRCPPTKAADAYDKLRTGYTRIILAAVALNYMPKSPLVATVLYGLSCLLDAIDGHAARLLHQTSRFGAVLDMITDRLVMLAVSA